MGMTVNMHRPDYVEAFRLKGDKSGSGAQWIVQFSDSSTALEQVTVFLTGTQLFALEQVITTAMSAPQERISATIDPDVARGFRVESKDV